MVLLSLSPLNNSSHSARGWPFQGYLGLSPISTHGTLRTRIGDDRNPLLASKITVAVRCYEARFNKLGSTTATNLLVDREQLLWQPVPGLQYDHIGDLDLPFRFLLPVDLPGPSTCHMPDYRVFWRLEAAIHHVPLVGQGTRQLKAFDLHFVRHDAPPPSPLRLASPTAAACLPTCAYSVTSPAFPVGPEDVLPLSLHLSHQHPNASLVKVAFSLERRIEHRDPSSSLSSANSKLAVDPHQSRPSPSGNSPLPTPPSTASSSDDVPLTRSDIKGKGKAKDNLDGFVKRTTSYFAFSSPSSSDADSSPAIKASTTTIASLEKTKAELVQQDASKGWTVDASLALPSAKPGHWSLGETLSTPLINVRYFLCAKATFILPASGSTSSIASTLSSSSTVTETVTIAPQDVTVVAIPSARRAYLQAKLRPPPPPPKEPRPVRRSSRRLRRRTSSTGPGAGAGPSSPTILVDPSPSGIVASSSSSTIGKSCSKKRCREREPALPSPPRSPALLSPPLPLPRIVVPKQQEEEDTRMRSSDDEREDDDDEEDKDAPFVLAGDLTFQRVPRRRHVASSGSSMFSFSSSFSFSSNAARSVKAAKTSSLTVPSLNTLARRPLTADLSRISTSESTGPGYQRATSVGAVSPTGVLLLAERMGGLMDVSERAEGGEDEDVESSPFSFSPPPPAPTHPVSSAPASAHASPASSVGTITTPPPEKRSRRSLGGLLMSRSTRRKS